MNYLLRRIDPTTAKATIGVAIATALILMAASVTIIG
jgi:hypothetical protein